MMTKTILRIVGLLWALVLGPSLGRADGLFLPPPPGPQVWKDLSVEFHQTSETPRDGFKPMVLTDSPTPENGRTFYVAPDPVVTLQDVTRVDVRYNMLDRDKLRLIFIFHAEGRDKLKDYTTAHAGEILGVVINGQLRCVPHIGRVINNGMLQLTGFVPNEAVDIASRFYAPRLDRMAAAPQPAATASPQP